MSAIRRRGAELRAVVRRRRRVRRIVLVVMAANVLMLSVLLTREPGDLSGLLLVALVTAAAVVLLHLAALLLPNWDRRAIRREITGQALTRAQSRRWALVGALVGAGASIVALSTAGMLDSWTKGAAIAAPILLMTTLWVVFTLREGTRSSKESTNGERASEPL